MIYNNIPGGNSSRDFINLIFDDLYPIGHIIHSYTCDTEAKVKASYRGNSWSQITNRFLYGSTNAGTTGGSNDAIVVSHTHTQKSCTNPGNHSHTPPGGYDWFVSYNGSATNWTAMGNGGVSVPLKIFNGTSSAGGHTHTITLNNTGENGTNANMPAYYTCYIWRRVS